MWKIMRFKKKQVWTHARLHPINTIKPRKKTVNHPFNKWVRQGEMGTKIDWCRKQDKMCGMKWGSKKVVSQMKYYALCTLPSTAGRDGKIRPWRATVLQSPVPPRIKHTCLQFRLDVSVCLIKDGAKLCSTVDLQDRIYHSYCSKLI